RPVPGDRCTVPGRIVVRTALQYPKLEVGDGQSQSRFAGLAAHFWRSVGGAFHGPEEHAGAGAHAMERLSRGVPAIRQRRGHVSRPAFAMAPSRLDDATPRARRLAGHTLDSGGDLSAACLRPGPGGRAAHGPRARVRIRPLPGRLGQPDVTVRLDARIAGGA